MLGHHVLFLFVLQTVKNIKAKPLITSTPHDPARILSINLHTVPLQRCLIICILLQPHDHRVAPMFTHTAASQLMRSSCLPVYIDLLRLPRPLAPCILTTCTLSRTNELLQREGGEKEAGRGGVDSINVKLGRGLVCGAPRRLFACKLFEQCCWAAVTAAASRSGLKKCQHTAESTGGCLTAWMANGSIASPPLHLKMCL